jgi:hypothetical protein
MFAAGKAETSREIPCGRWEGSWSREEDADFGVVYQDGRLTLPMMPPAPLPFRMVDEGRGRFRATLGAVDLLGIYQQQDERVELRKASESPYKPSAKKWTRLRREPMLPSLVLM